MSAYLYAVIPYDCGIRFHDNDENKFVYGYMPRELNNLSIEFDEDMFIAFSDFVLINTCWSMSFLNCEENGFCFVRNEIYKIAKALNASEVWYVEETSTDKMMEPDFNFEDWKRSLKEELAYCTKDVNLEMLRNNQWASYCHDDFSDIVLEPPTNEE